MKELEGVTTIAEWPATVRLSQLWSCLTGPAKSYALRDNVQHIEKLALIAEPIQWNGESWYMRPSSGL